MPVPLFYLDAGSAATLDWLEAYQVSPAVDQIMRGEAPPAYVPGVTINQVWEPATRTYRDPTREEVIEVQMYALTHPDPSSNPSGGM